MYLIFLLQFCHSTPIQKRTLVPMNVSPQPIARLAMIHSRAGGEVQVKISPRVKSPATSSEDLQNPTDFKSNGNENGMKPISRVPSLENLWDSASGPALPSKPEAEFEKIVHETVHRINNIMSDVSGGVYVLAAIYQLAADASGTNTPLDSVSQDPLQPMQDFKDNSVVQKLSQPVTKKLCSIMTPLVKDFEENSQDSAELLHSVFKHVGAGLSIAIAIHSGATDSVGASIRVLSDLKGAAQAVSENSIMRKVASMPNLSEMAREIKHENLPKDFKEHEENIEKLGTIFKVLSSVKAGIGCISCLAGAHMLDGAIHLITGFSPS